MDPYHAMFRRNCRPVCRMWQMGRCEFNSIQCEFRHSEPGVNAQPTLDEAFAPSLRLPDSRWSDHQMHTDRQPLQELVLPASSSSIVEMDQSRPGLVFRQSPLRTEVDHGGWESPRSSPRGSLRGSPRIQPSADNTFEEMQFNTSGQRMSMGVVSQTDAFNAWKDERVHHEEFVPDYDITIYEDPEEFDGDAPMSESYTDDEISRLAELSSDSEEEDPDKENDHPQIMSNVMQVDMENQLRRQAGEVNLTQRTDATTRESSSPQRAFTFLSTIPSFNMNQTRDISQNGGAANTDGVGPHPSYIQVANPYIFEQSVQNSLTALGATEHKEDSLRLQGVHYIDSVRKALQLPVRTFNTAVVYYHKFRLVHADSEYMFADAAAAALFCACKIEDTLKKSREVLCAAHNLKFSSSEHLSPDDPIFEQPSKTVVGLERLMLESAGFDFRNRHPQELVLKLVKESGLPKETLGRTAYNMSIDIYRTFAPLKQTAQTMAIACVELTARLLNMTTDFNMDAIVGPQGISLEKWSTTRGEIMETLLDLLDLFTHHRHATVVGGQFSIDNYIALRISLNKEATSSNIPRYSEWIDAPKSVLNGASNGGAKHSPISPAIPGSNQSPNSPPAMGPATATGARSRVGERGKDGTVRFMLSAERARGEKEVVAKFFAADEWEEYEEEVDVPLGQ